MGIVEKPAQEPENPLPGTCVGDYWDPGLPFNWPVHYKDWLTVDTWNIGGRYSYCSCINYEPLLLRRGRGDYQLHGLEGKSGFGT